MKINLMTKEIERKLPALYATDGSEDKAVIVKFFTPDSNWSWYVFEGNKTDDGDYEFFGLVDGFEKELGYFRLSDLAAIKGPMGLKVERDRFFEGKYVNDEIVGA